MSYIQENLIMEDSLKLKEILDSGKNNFIEICKINYEKYKKEYQINKNFDTLLILNMLKKFIDNNNNINYDLYY
jgi:hypothetical protein